MSVEIKDEFSLRRIQRLLWLPIGVLVAAFFVAIGVQDGFEQANHGKKLGAAWTTAWQRHQPLMVNELVLGQSAAVVRRAESLGSEMSQAFPGYSFCVSIVPKMDWPAVAPRCPSSDGNVVVDTIDVQMGPEALASVQLVQTARPTLVDQIPKRLALPFFFSLLISVVAVQLIGRKVTTQIVAPLLKLIEIRSRDAAIGRTSQMLAHDIRRPFTLFEIAVSAVESAATPAEALAALQHHLPAVRQAQKRTSTMLQDVMDVGLQAGKTLAVAPTSVAGMVTDVLQDVEGARADKSISISCNHQGKDMALIEVTKIERVLTNILVNAIEAVPAGGSIDIKTFEHSSGRIGVRIQNTGSYVAEADRIQIFDSFFTSGKRDGTGLGLTIAKSFVEQHGGSLWCESDEQRGGITTFVFTIPACPSVPAAQRAVGRIVVVEDDPFLLEVWARSLANPLVTTFESPTAFFARLDGDASFLADVVGVVTDFHFENDKLDGADLVKGMRSRGIRLPIFVTSDADVSASLPADVKMLPKSRAPFIAVSELCRQG